MKKNPVVWFFVGWLFALLVSPNVFLGVFRGTPNRATA